MSAAAVLGCVGALVPGVAHAVATDAVQGCGAYDVGGGTATVPPANQSAELFSVQTTDGTFAIRCGNGTSTGAVHIEVKHEVPTWADALSCITKAIDRTVGSYDANSGKTVYTYAITGGSVKVVRGGVGIITAYPVGGGVAQKWETCSAS